MSAATSLREYLLASSAVSDLIGSRLHADTLPQGCELPAVAYHVIDAPREHGLGGPSDLVRTRIQIDCHATHRLDADAVADAITAALEQFAVPADMAGTWVMTIELAGPAWTHEAPDDGSDEWERVSSLDVILHHRV